MHLLLVLLNKPNQLKSTCIDHYSFACCFSRFSERCEVIVTHYFKENQVFFVLYATKTSVLQRFNFACCGSAAEESKAVFIKIVMAHKTHVISCNILMIKRKDRKCYVYLKFHINQSYNFMLSTVF